MKKQKLTEDEKKLRQKEEEDSIWLSFSLGGSNRFIQDTNEKNKDDKDSDDQNKKKNG